MASRFLCLSLIPLKFLIVLFLLLGFSEIVCRFIQKGKKRFYLNLKCFLFDGPADGSILTEGEQVVNLWIESFRRDNKTENKIYPSADRQLPCLGFGESSAPSLVRYARVRYAFTKPQFVLPFTKSIEGRPDIAEDVPSLIYLSTRTSRRYPQ